MFRISHQDIKTKGVSKFLKNLKIKSTLEYRTSISVNANAMLLYSKLLLLRSAGMFL